ncbi:hypothetical protein P175DRAFT_0503949 [Aspergillus ochraceoroseus IBT 24754]|uniref:Uncharacterized protein n=3 Tax=Aspergillus subgen. Nidulantes TaxID=2720870 RepID=A0A0F8UIM2_9EURO|nr:uncharacterized protein P175DRAFT_0503949 [Aspergillus ochraceoroseus IBT 24754]KKK14002.1 hypothetical protein AOCH_006236 [Aspergillus ochraceoroseus]KKK19514.1 hypothetical protein ARAM_003483 [Aspergillus rambellii]PTU18062.1 hypothetical protein P175DRAFT_0503949 [Aspergillus ochraceoroseus IBT 24754]
MHSSASLENIHTLSPAAKTALMQSLAHEMTSTFIAISKEIQRGTLTPHNTVPLHQVIRTITHTTAAAHRKLERKLTAYERRAKRWRAERRWIRQEFAQVVWRSKMVHLRWKTRVERHLKWKQCLNWGREEFW